MADDKHHRPCLPLKPQEKKLVVRNNILNQQVNIHGTIRTKRATVNNRN